MFSIKTPAERGIRNQALIRSWVSEDRIGSMVSEDCFGAGQNQLAVNSGLTDIPRRRESQGFSLDEVATS